MPHRSSATPILLIVGLLVLGVIAYLWYTGTLSSSMSSVSSPSTSSVPASSPAASSSAASSPAAPTYKYVQSAGPGVWDPNPSGAYTCPQTKIAGYCIVPDTATAQSLCSADPNCVGYAVAGNGSGTIQLLNKQPVSNPSANGTFYSKTSS